MDYRERRWFKQFTSNELKQWAGRTKLCPLCKQLKEIIDGFGLRRRRYPGDPPDAVRRRITARDRCFPCQAKTLRERFKRNQPEKYAARLRKIQEWSAKPENQAKRLAGIKRWQQANPEKIRQYNRTRYQRYPHHTLARLIAKLAYPIAQQCEVADCTTLGVRHHDDYSKPLEIRWLCRKHHVAADRAKRDRDRPEQARVLSNVSKEKILGV